MARHIRAFDGRRTGGKRTQGMSLIEVVLSISSFLIVLLAFSRALASTSKSAGLNYQTVAAREAVRACLETLQAEDFDTVFQRYNDDPTDDPEGAGSAAGSNFAVQGLSALDTDADGLVGRISFPVNVNAPGTLREDLVLPAFGLPADLDADGFIESDDKSLTKLYLPVLVLLEWESASGPARLEMRTILANY